MIRIVWHCLLTLFHTIVCSQCGSLRALHATRYDNDDDDDDDAGLVTTDDDGTVRVMHDVVADAAEDCASNRAHAARPDHDHQRLLVARHVDDGLSWLHAAFVAEANARHLQEIHGSKPPVTFKCTLDRHFLHLDGEHVRSFM